MKNILNALIVLLMITSLWGCGKKKVNINQIENVIDKENDLVKDEDNNSDKDDDGEHDADDISANDSDIDQTDDSKIDSDNDQYADNNFKKVIDPIDINPVDATIEEPAKIGEWVATKLYSAEDKAYHTVYYRITDIIRYNEDVQAILDEKNSNGSSIYIFDPLEDKNLEYCMLNYEVNFPEDFPQADYGITSVKIDFTICGIEGGSVKTDDSLYIGLSSVYNFSERLDINTFYAGETFTEGKSVFVMVKDFSDYVIESKYREDGEKYTSYVAGE